MTSTHAMAQIALTPSGLAYAEAKLKREAIENEIERLIAMLDAIDGDPDAEPVIGWAWKEPSHGYARSHGDECEEDSDKAIEDDPHDHGDDNEIGAPATFLEAVRASKDLWCNP